MEDKLPMIMRMAQSSQAVLVGGKLVREIKDRGIRLPKNVRLARMRDDGFDIAKSTVTEWGEIINDTST